MWYKHALDAKSQRVSSVAKKILRVNMNVKDSTAGMTHSAFQRVIYHMSVPTINRVIVAAMPSVLQPQLARQVYCGDKKYCSKYFSPQLSGIQSDEKPVYMKDVPYCIHVNTMM